MKKINLIIFFILSALIFATSCSNNEDILPESGKSYVINNGKIYIDSYATEGMRYSPVTEKSLPKCILNLFEKRPEEIKDYVIFEGEYKGCHVYWTHSIWSSCNYPLPFSTDGELDEDIPFTWNDIYPNLTCIYFGEKYALYHRPVYITE